MGQEATRGVVIRSGLGPASHGGGLPPLSDRVRDSAPLPVHGGRLASAGVLAGPTPESEAGSFGCCSPDMPINDGNTLKPTPGSSPAHQAEAGVGSTGSPPSPRMPIPSPRSGSRIRLTASLRERTPSLPNAEERWLFDRALSEEQLSGDLAVHIAHDDQPEDLLLACGERRWIDLATVLTGHARLTCQHRFHARSQDRLKVLRRDDSGDSSWRAPIAHPNARCWGTQRPATGPERTVSPPRYERPARRRHPRPTEQSARNGTPQVARSDCRRSRTPRATSRPPARSRRSLSCERGRRQPRAARSAPAGEHA